MQPIIEELRGKKVAILGFGREGQSTYAYIRKYLPSLPITIADAKQIDTSSLMNVVTQCGSDYQNLEGYDVIFKSPGIVLENENQLAIMNSQTNMFLKYYGKQTIGITGTKGKSTTSSLLYHMLKENGKDVIFLGNIGLPAFDEIEHLHENTIVVFELSCHQLEYTKHAPHISVLLNIYEEHLDHYGTYEKYIHAKENIWRVQTEHDRLLCEASCISEQICSKVISVSMQDEQADIYAGVQKIKIMHDEIIIEPMNNPLLGHHNMFDLAIDLYLVQLYNISLKQALEALKSFKPLPHRLQYVGMYDGIHWYDDSISTICETTIQALETLPETTTLFIGGMNRGIDYAPLVKYLQEHPVKHIILMPDSGEILGKQLNNTCVHHAQDLQTAVAIAKEVTLKGTIALLSPAAASYGFFKNFEDRGMQFQRYVKGDI